MSKKRNQYRFEEQSKVKRRIDGSTELPKNKRKHWSIHDLKTVTPLTNNQSLVFEYWAHGQNLGLFGCAGTGKTLLALNAALEAVLDPRTGINRIFLVRSAVQTRDQGALPGDLSEKMAEYEIPYQEAMADLLGRPNSYRDLKAAGIVEFQSTSFLRSRTVNDAVIIFDECQNATFRELDTVITRTGTNSRLILVGDTKQNDLKDKREKSGLPLALQILRKIGSLGIVEFTPDDVVRSALAREWIRECYGLDT